jgi:hypothetical protein
MHTALEVEVKSRDAMPTHIAFALLPNQIMSLCDRSKRALRGLTGDAGPAGDRIRGGERGSLIGDGILMAGLVRPRRVLAWFVICAFPFPVRLAPVRSSPSNSTTNRSRHWRAKP